jgi:hypothetical protein
MKKLENYNDFYNWTKENGLDYEFGTKKYANDTIYAFNKEEHDNWISVPYPGKKGSWNKTKNTIKKALL